MELYQLRAFIAVAEHGNVTRAAEHLYTSQPAVSAQIKALEQTFGVALFDRTPAGMALTEPGSRLLEHARATLAHAQATEDLAKHLRTGTAGRIRIALNDAGERNRVDALSRALLAEHPDIQIDFINGTSGDAMHAIRQYAADVGFFEGPINDAAIDAIDLGTTDLCIVLPNGWDNVSDWSALARYPWVFTSPTCSYHKELTRLCERFGFEPQKQFRLDHDSVSLHLVREGLAVSMVDRTFAKPYADVGELTIWPHYQGRIPFAAICLSKRKQEPAITAFRDAVCRIFAPDRAKV